LKYANENKLPILYRGSATSLAGQTVNEAIVIDFTKSFKSIVEINIEEQYAIVQPGVIRDQLNAAISKYNLHFAPDPATSSRATIGGMIANNSSGTKSILYGKTNDHVIELKIMLVDGSIITLQNLSEEEYNIKCNQNDIEGNIYKTLRQEVFQLSDEIMNRYPKTMRRVGGYALDAFINTNEWNLCNLICGSEGTLAAILEAKVKLTPLPKYQNMVVLHFNDRIDAVSNVERIVALKPAAVEMLDFNVLENSKNNIITKKYYDNTIIGDPKAILTVEFYGDTKEEVDSKANYLIDILKDDSSVYATLKLDEMSKINDSLSLRKDGLGLIMNKPGLRKPLPFIEDAAIPLQDLPNYIKELIELCREYGSEVVLYAHASVGVLHVRPTLDLSKEEDVRRLKEISDKCFALVMKYKGSWSSEHGDGRSRSPKMKEFYGEKIYESFKKIKAAFDPYNLLNPNIIIDAPDMNTNLRYDGNYKEIKHDFIYKYRKEKSFQDVVHNCSGVGACRNHTKGTMCPSFRATGDEYDSTRARANVLRLAMSNQMNLHDLTDPEVKNVMDLCLSCKACKSECPSNVDIAKLKSEVLQKHYDKHGKKLSELIPYYSASLSKWFHGMPSYIINPLLSSSIVKKINQKILNVNSRRPLPFYAKQSLSAWFKTQKKKENKTESNDSNESPKMKVALFADTYINYHETELGKHVINLLGKLNCSIWLIDAGCCQRPRISNGFLREAKKELEILAKELEIFIDGDMKIVVVEPSCTTALIDDLPDLIDDEALGKKIKNNVVPIETFILERIKALPHHPIKAQEKEYILHGHCHQKSTYSTRDAINLLETCGAKVKELDSTCCGMAGAFGYDKNHYEMSTILGNKLVNQIKDSGCDHIVSNGFSCRHQIKDFSDMEAKHVVELLGWVE
jgi:FAD/FMN-containing dehydrogenase/Fe-S oxidoreductase